MCLWLMCKKEIRLEELSEAAVVYKVGQVYETRVLSTYDRIFLKAHYMCQPGLNIVCSPSRTYALLAPMRQSQPNHGQTYTFDAPAK